MQEKPGSSASGLKPLNGESSLDDPHELFRAATRASLSRAAADKDLQAMSRMWVRAAAPYNYAYNFTALGRPAIQFPQDMIAVQELVWRIKPDVIVETGVAHGGSLIFSASLLTILDYCDALAEGTLLDPQKPKRRVVGVDIDIRPHNRAAIEDHPMANRIDLIQGSSIDAATIAQVRQKVGKAKTVLVALDSNHTHAHVLAELEAYAPLVSVGSYCIVFDTLIEDMPDGSFPDRPWDKGDNPKTAVHEFLKQNTQFQIDSEIDHKLLISVAPDGYLKRVS